MSIWQRGHIVWHELGNNKVLQRTAYTHLLTHKHNCINTYTHACRQVYTYMQPPTHATCQLWAHHQQQLKPAPSMLPFCTGKASSLPQIQQPHITLYTDVQNGDSNSPISQCHACNKINSSSWSVTHYIHSLIHAHAHTHWSAHSKGEP